MANYSQISDNIERNFFYLFLILLHSYHCDSYNRTGIRLWTCMILISLCYRYCCTSPKVSLGCVLITLICVSLLLRYLVTWDYPLQIFLCATDILIFFPDNSSNFLIQFFNWPLILYATMISMETGWLCKHISLDSGLDILYYHITWFHINRFLPQHISLVILKYFPWYLNPTAECIRMNDMYLVINL